MCVWNNNNSKGNSSVGVAILFIDTIIIVVAVVVVLCQWTIFLVLSSLFQDGHLPLQLSSFSVEAPPTDKRCHDDCRRQQQTAAKTKYIVCVVSVSVHSTFRCPSSVCLPQQSYPSVIRSVLCGEKTLRDRRRKKRSKKQPPKKKKTRRDSKANRTLTSAYKSVVLALLLLSVDTGTDNNHNHNHKQQHKQ